MAQLSVAKTVVPAPGIHTISVHNIVLDDRFQSRDRTDPDWTASLSRFYLDGSKPTPPTLYYIEGDVACADGKPVCVAGFHTLNAILDAIKLNPELTDVECEVRHGTFEDAVACSTGSNRGNGKKAMGSKDFEKSVKMLFAIEKWWNRADTFCASHVGCSSGTVRKIRARFALENGREIPCIRQRPDGAFCRTADAGPECARMPHRGSRPSKRFSGRFDGRRYYGDSPGAVDRALADAREKSDARRHTLSPASSAQFFALNGFRSVFRRGIAHHYRLIAYQAPGLVCASVDLKACSRDLPSTIGSLRAAGRHTAADSRMIVVCYPDDGSKRILDLFRADGIEFMTPEELVELLKAEKG